MKNRYTYSNFCDTAAPRERSWCRTGFTIEQHNGIAKSAFSVRMGSENHTLRTRARSVRHQLENIVNINKNWCLAGGQDGNRNILLESWNSFKTFIFPRSGGIDEGEIAHTQPPLKKSGIRNVLEVCPITSCVLLKYLKLMKLEMVRQGPGGLKLTSSTSWCQN